MRARRAWPPPSYGVVGETRMKALLNKTRLPIQVPLPGGKVLRLAPGKSGQIRDDALEQPAVKKLIKAGDVEVHEDSGREGGIVGGGTLANQGGQKRGRSTFRQRKGDR